MVDTRTSEQRTRIMRSVGTRNTGPELVVRQMLHALGLRFRLHRRDLPGRPDIVLPKHRTVIFVHGCFWHSHGCKKGQLPKSSLDYWRPKLERNKQRDREAIEQLERSGWRTIVVWQCELKAPCEVADHLRRSFDLPTDNSIDFCPEPS